MTKQHFFFLLFIFPVFAYGQTVDYSLEMVQKDSFFLIETYTAAPTQGEPRGQTVISYKLFRSMGELLDFVNTGLDVAEKEIKEAQEKATVCRETKNRLNKIRSLTDKNRP